MEAAVHGERKHAGTAAPAPLHEILRLEQVGEHTFLGRSQPGTATRTFGGEVAGQAVMAAGRTVPSDRLIHSAHAHFLLPGDSGSPVLYRVDLVRDGGSFTTRKVEAVQHGKVIFCLTASFHRPEEGFSHQVPALSAPAPEEVPPAEENPAWDDATRAWFRFLMSGKPVLMRFPEIPTWSIASRGEAAPPRQRAWLRSATPMPDDPLLHAGALTYISDLLMLSTALGPHGITILHPNLQFATIEHTVWFHQPTRADEWFMYDQESFWAGSARGLCRGWIFDRSGRLVATTMQEGLLRLRA